MSGQQWGTVVGGIVGAYLGNAQLGMAIGGYIGGVIDPTVIKGPSIGDAQQQTSQAGRPIPRVYGHSPPIAGTIVDGDNIARKVKHRQGGKGSTTVTETEGFVATRLFLLCESPGGTANVARIRRNGKLIYDATGTGDLDADSASFASKLTILRGGDDQLPHPALEAIHGVGNTPYYRGRLCVLIEDDDETQTGGAANQYLFEVSSCAGVLEAQITPRWWLVESAGVDAGGGNANRVYQTDDITAPDWKGPYNLTAADSSFMSLGAFDTGVSVLYVADGGTTYEVSGDFNPGDGVFTTTKGTFPWAVARVRCFGYGRVIALAGASSPRPTFLLSLNGGLVWEEFEWTPAGGISTSGLFDVAEVAPDEWVCSGKNAAGDVKLYNGVGKLGAITWTAAPVGTGVIAGNTVVSAGGNAYTLGNPGGTGNGVISKYQDGTWTKVGEIVNLWNANEGIATTLGSVVFSASGFGNGIVFLDGDTWSAYATTWEVQRFVDYNGTIVATVTTSGGSEVARYSTDGGETFTEITSPTTAQHVVSIVQPHKVYAITLPDATGYTVDEDGNIAGPERDTLEDCRPSWADVVTDICARAGLPADKLDIDIMTDEVPGYVLSRLDLSAADYLRELCAFYLVNLVEYDGQIHAVRRGGDVVATITDDDLLEVEDDDDDDRPQTLEAPGRVTIYYPDPANNYVTTPQVAERTSPDVQSSSEINVQCTIPFDAARVAQLADIFQKVEYDRAEGSVKRSLPAEHSNLVPSDPIKVRNRRHVIKKIAYDDCMVSIEADYERASSFTSLATGADAPTPQPPVSNLKGPTVLVAMNLPSLRPEDNVGGMYVGVRGILPGWPGCDLYYSPDGGASEVYWGRIYDRAVIGSLTDSFAIDDTTLAVKVPGGSLASVGDDEIEAGQNAAAVLSAGVAEILQFKTATNTGDFTYDLTDLSPGLQGTTEAAHGMGDTFVLLDTRLRFVPLPLSLAGKTVIWRAVTLGTLPANNATVSTVFDPPTFIIDGGEVTP